MKKYEINDEYRLKAKVNYTDVLQVNIIIKVVALGVVFCSAIIEGNAIEWSLQKFILSYDINLFVVGLAVCLSFFAFSNYLYYIVYIQTI